MKKINVLLIVILVIIISSCKKPSNKDLLLGGWQLVDYKIENSSNISLQTLNKIKEENNYYKSKRYQIYFMVENRFMRTENNIVIETDGRLHYKLVDRKNTEDANGIIIFFFMYEIEQKIYHSTNNLGPYEIVSLTKKELILKDINPDVLKETKGQVLAIFKTLKK